MQTVEPTEGIVDAGYIDAHGVELWDLLYVGPIIKDFMLLLVALGKTNHTKKKSSFVMSALQTNPFTFRAIAPRSTTHEKILTNQETWGEGRECVRT